MYTMICSMTLTTLLVACAMFTVTQALPTSLASAHLKTRNFISTDALVDGEQERRFHYNGITAKETAVSTGVGDGIKLLQITDGVHFIQLIYGGDDDIRDCEFVRQKKIIHNFLDTFRKDLVRARDSQDVMSEDASDAFETEYRNVTFEILKDDVPLPGDLAQWMDYEGLKQQCKRKHKEIKQLVDHKEHGTEEQKRHAADHLERYKRGLAAMFIAPGTKWCGHRRTADRYAQLGGFSSTDRCCRRHDHCPLNIPGLGSKYNLINYRLFTVSHCGCDQSFRTCLKMSGTGAANIVGKLFFNVVQAKCFVLKPKKECIKRSWWDKCEKYQYTKQAYLRDNVSY